MRERRHSKISGMDELGGPGAMEEFGGNAPVRRNIPYISSDIKDGWTFYCSGEMYAKFLVWAASRLTPILLSAKGSNNE